MPVPTDNLYNMDKLNRWFAFSSICLLLSFVWMIWEDYDRPWRGFQDDYMVVQAAMAHLDYLQTQTESYQQGLNEARQAVEVARASSAARMAERDKLSMSLRKENDKYDEIKLTSDTADAILDVTRDEYEVIRNEKGGDSPQGKAAYEELRRQSEHADRLRLSKESVEDAQRSLKAAIAQIDSGVTETKKRVARIEKTAADAARKEKQYSGFLVKMVINMPLADFTAPKGTPSRHEIRQLVLPGIRQELNYLQTYTTDRCTTCHIAIDDRDFTMESLARRFERAMPAINEALGDDVLPYPDLPQLVGEDVPQLERGKVTDYWSLLSTEQQETYFSRLTDFVNAYLKQTGRKEIHLEHPLLAHPNLDLFVDVDSPHAMVKMGCTICHEGNPQETDFVQAAHTPVDHHQEKEWKEKYYVTAASVPNVTFETVQHYWDRTMYPPKYTEAGCANCHTRIADISDFRGESQAKSLNLGRDLFVRVGCVNCHKDKALGTPRRVGPDLRRVASKLSRDFIEPWVYHPERFRPSTWMPHLFLQENNGARSASEADPNPTLRTESEVMAMAFYLETLSQPWKPTPIPEGLAGDVERGRKLFGEVGCLGCHANVAEHGQEMIVEDLKGRGGRSERVAEALYDEMSYVERVDHLLVNVPTDRDTVFAPETIGDRRVFTRFAPELSAIGQKVSREWLFGWLKDPSSYNEETRMPSLRLTDQEALDVAEYLTTLRENDSFTSSRFPADEDHLAMVDDLMFEILTGQNSARRSRSIMADENGELTAMLAKTLRKYWNDEKTRSTLGKMDGESKRLMYLGNKMIAHYGCYACHEIGGFEVSPPPGTDLSSWGEKPLSQLDFAFFSHAFDHVREARPEVFGHVYRPEDEDLIRWAHGHNPEESITHTHAAFASHKLLNPRIWDREKIKGPYDKLKMPNFYFTPQQVDALVTYLLSRRPSRATADLQVDYDTTLTGAIADGRTLSRSLNCVGCHKIEENKATVHQYYRVEVGGEEQFDEVNAPPWLRGEGSKAQFPWFYGFLGNVEELRPWLKIRMPTFDLSDEEITTLVKYFAGISQREAATLNGHLAGVKKYIDAARDRPDDVPAADPWFVSDAHRDTAEFLAAYTVKNRLVLKYDVDPGLNSLEELKVGYSEVLKQARFAADLFDISFPFADSPRALVDEERFKKGEALFYELKCLACHVLGDPNIEGSNANPSAPNLNLAHRRLRQAWSHQWFQEPASMQPGTKMPQWFGDGSSAFGSYTDEDRASLEAEYGTTGEEQMELLMDFMYNAGVLNYTALQPGGLSAGVAGDEEFDDDEEEEEEEEE